MDVHHAIFSRVTAGERGQTDESISTKEGFAAHAGDHGEVEPVGIGPTNGAHQVLPGREGLAISGGFTALRRRFLPPFGFE